MNDEEDATASNAKKKSTPINGTNPFASLEAELLRTAPTTGASQTSFKGGNGANRIISTTLDHRNLNQESSNSKRAKVLPDSTSDAPVRIRTIQESIVGWRPKHWNTATVSSHPSNRNKNRRTNFKEKEANNVEKFKHRQQNLIRPQNKGSIMEVDSNEKDNPVAISFAPSFLSSKSQSKEAAMDLDHDVAGVQNSDDMPLDICNDTDPTKLWRPALLNDSTSFSSSSHASKPSANLQPGPLMQRMQSIRQVLQGDIARLSSGQYPFSIRSKDRNDPRNRADTIMNVTILGDPTSQMQASNLAEPQLVTLPCFVHNLMKATSDSDRAFINVSLPRRYVSIMFTYETVQEQGIVHGSQLRLYNAIYVPMRKQIATMPEGESVGNSTTQEEEDGVIVCTQLCEQYPKSILPPLVLPKTPSGS